MMPVRRKQIHLQSSPLSGRPDSRLFFKEEIDLALTVKHRDGRTETFSITGERKKKRTPKDTLRWYKQNATTHIIEYPDGCEFIHGIVMVNGRKEFWDRARERSCDHSPHHRKTPQDEEKQFQNWLKEHPEAED
jgi:hypothetical protein